MRSFKVTIVACYLLTASLAFSQTPQMDGLFDDWAAGDVAAKDVQGDALGAFDITKVSAKVVGTAVFLRFDTTNLLNLQSGPEDDGTLELVFDLPRDRTLRVDFRGRQAVLQSANAASTIPWSDMRFVSLPT